MATYFCPSCGTYADALAADSLLCSCGAQRMQSFGVAPALAASDTEPAASQWVSPIERAAESLAGADDEIIEPEIVPDVDLGMWRDGKWLVLRNTGAGFPARCVKTNQPAHDTSQDLVLHEPLPGGGWWALLFGFVGVLVAQSAGKSTSVRVPLSRQWLDDYQRRGRHGWIIIVAGIVGFVLVTLIAIVAAAADSALFPWIMGCLALCPIVSFAGMIYLGRQHKPILSARKITRQFTWIDGVGTEFLASLPKWDGPHLGKGMV